MRFLSFTCVVCMIFCSLFSIKFHFFFLCIDILFLFNMAIIYSPMFSLLFKVTFMFFFYFKIFNFYFYFSFAAGDVKESGTCGFNDS